MLLLFIASFIGAGVSIYGKNYIDKGLSARKFIFIQTFSMLVINGLLFFFYPFELVITVTSISLIVANALLRIVSVTIGADNLKHITALEHSAYTSFAIILTYLIDILISSNTFTILGASAIIFIVVGSVLMAKGHLSFKQVGWKLIIRIICMVLRGYVTYFALKEIGNITFIFLTFVASAIILLPFIQYFTKQKITKVEWKFSFISQSLSLIAFIAGNVLAKDSATLYMLIRPMNMVIIFLATLFVTKKQRQKLSFMQIIGAVIIIIGISVFTLNKL